MGYQKYVRECWKKPKKNLGKTEWQEWIIKLRKEPAIIRTDKPKRIDRARSLGYKAKQGFFIVRVRTTRGKRKRPQLKGGRRPKRYVQYVAPGKSYKRIAEERASKRYPNAEVLNSYWVGDDGKHKWYEVIMIDRDHPAILKDKQVKNIAAQKRRAVRGLTSAGKKGRGMRKK